MLVHGVSLSVLGRCAVVKSFKLLAASSWLVEIHSAIANALDTVINSEKFGANSPIANAKLAVERLANGVL